MLRIKLRYDDVEVMVQRFAANVGKSGLFLPTKSLQPIGAEIKFELRLADDTAVLVGLGRVKAAKAPDPANAKATFGMAIELMRVTPQSRALILRMLERRRALGLPEVQLPMAADIDAARQAGAVESARDVASGPVVATATPGAGTPVAGAALPALEPAPSAILTAPRRQTGPISVAKVLAIAPLGPEPPRRKRMAISEILETASGPIASLSIATPGLDDDVDVAAALVRARALAGGAVDAELDALAEVAAVPVEISIEGASAELARQLGGSAVRRDRSARWAPPPATIAGARSEHDVERAAAGEAARDSAHADAQLDAGAEARRDVGTEAKQDAGAEAAPAADAEAADAEAAPDAGHAAAVSVTPVDAVDAVDAINAIGAADSAEMDAIAAINAIADVEPEGLEPPSFEIDPSQIADEIHQLNDFDLEDVEHTEAGAIPEPGLVGLGGFGIPDGFAEPHGFAVPAELGDAPELDPVLLAARLEADLASAEAEADADDLGLAAPDPGDAPIDLSLEEIDEFEILAEADAEDEDLLAAHGEHDASGEHELDDPAPTGVRPSVLDFAARLDLGDESDAELVLPGHAFSARHAIDSLSDELADALGDDPQGDDFADDAGMPDAHLHSAGQALAAFETGDEPLDDPDDPGEPGAGGGALEDPDDHHDRFAQRRIVQPIFEPEASSSFTLAGIPSDDFELPPRPQPRETPRPQPRETPRPQPRETPRPGREPARATREPAVPRAAAKLPSLHESPVEDHELEHALEALDVDLDDLSIPHAATQLQRDTDKSRPTVAIRPSALRTPAPAPPAEDEVVIDFEDDD